MVAQEMCLGGQHYPLINSFLLLYMSRSPVLQGQKWPVLPVYTYKEVPVSCSLLTVISYIQKDIFLIIVRPTIVYTIKLIVFVVFSNVVRRKIFVVAGSSRLENVAVSLQEEIESVTDN